MSVVLAVLTTLVVGVTGASRVVAAAGELNGLKASGTLTADRYATWYAQATRPGVCRLLPGCVASSGSGKRWSFTMQVDVPGVGVQTMDVAARVTRQRTFRLLRLALFGDGAAGTFRADVQVGLASRGTGTAITLTIVSARATGAVIAAIPLLRDNLQDNLHHQLGLLDAQRAAAGATVSMTLAKGKRTTASIRIAAATLTDVVPTARGTVRVLLGTKQLCQARLKRSQARCSFPPPRRGAVLRAVAVGGFPSGVALWTSGTRKVR